MNHVSDKLEFDENQLISLTRSMPQTSIYNKTRLLLKSPIEYAKMYGSLFSIAQEISVTELFRIGIRYFHAHVILVGDTLKVTNSLVGGDLNTYINRLASLLEEYIDEYIIIHIEKILGIKTNKLTSKINQLKNDSRIRIVSGDIKLHNLNLELIIKSSKRILLMLPESFQNNSLINFRDGNIVHDHEIRGFINFKRPISNKIVIEKFAFESDYIIASKKIKKSDKFFKAYQEGYIKKFQDIDTIRNIWYTELKDKTTPTSGYYNKNDGNKQLTWIISMSFMNSDISKYIIMLNSEDILVE